MNLTWHIVKKDLRALKWPLAFWFLCIVAKLGIGVTMLAANGDEGVDWFKSMSTVAMVLASAEALSFVFVAALIQEDLMVGTTAFWMTRPISGGRLLRAKLLFIGLVFLLAPVLVTLPWWLGCHYGLGEIAWAAAETVAVHAIVLLVGLLWAAVTDGLGRFLMWTLATLAAVPMLIGSGAFYVGRLRGVGASVASDVVSTRFLLALIIVIIGTAVVLVHQYLTRHTWRTIGIIGGVVTLIFLVGAFWPWAWHWESRMNSWLLTRAQAGWAASAEPAGLKFTWEAATLEMRPSSPRLKRPATLQMRFRVDGLDAAQALSPASSEYTLRWADGTVEHNSGWGRSGMMATIAERALGTGSRPARDGTYADTIKLTGLVPARMTEKLQSNSPALTLNARFQLLKFEAVTPVAKQPGAWEVQRAGVAERVGVVEKDGERLLVTFIRHAPSLWVDNAGGRRFVPVWKYSMHFLVNRANDHVDRGSLENKQTARIGTVEIAWNTMAYRASNRRGTPQKPSLEAMNALDDAELVKVAFAAQSTFTHEFRVDPFTAELTTP